jgi:elongation factor 3
MTHQGKTAVVEDAIADAKSLRGSGTNTPARSRPQSGTNTPARSRPQTPLGPSSLSAAVGGLVEGSDSPAPPVRRKKKLTRNQLKAQEERRRLRKLHWLTVGGPKPEDTDSDIDP